MAYNKRRKSNKVTYGKAFRKKTSRGKHRKGTLIKYKYQNGRRVGAVKHRSPK
jgi:hypothetical protein